MTLPAAPSTISGRTTWPPIGGSGDGRGPAARFGHNAAWVEESGSSSSPGRARPPSSTTCGPTTRPTDRWRKLPAGGDPPVRATEAAPRSGPDGRLWISHGFTSEGSRFADTRAYDFTTQAWTDETPAGERPVERCLHGCWWTDDGRLALYAGQTTGVPALGDLWQLTPGPRIGTNAWTELAAGTAGRRRGSCTRRPAGDREPSYSAAARRAVDSWTTRGSSGTTAWPRACGPARSGGAARRGADRRSGSREAAALRRSRSGDAMNDTVGAALPTR